MFLVQYTGPQSTKYAKKESPYVVSEPLPQDADAEEPSPELDCAVCLDLLCEPIQLPCSHTFCRNCLVRVSQRKCPLCRALHPEDFDPVTAKIDQPLEELVRHTHPEEYAQRVQKAVAERSRMLSFIVGNRHQEIANPKRSKNGKHLNRHKWTLFVELQQNGRSAEELIDKVRFKLAPYYTAWPSNDHHSIKVGKNPEVRSAPFEVTRIGWGYFPTTIIITWKSWLGLPPTELEHELCFDGNGSTSEHKIDVGDVLASAHSRTTGGSTSATGRSSS